MDKKAKIGLFIKAIVAVVIITLVAVWGFGYYKDQQLLKAQAMEVDGKKVTVGDVKNEINYQLAKVEYATGKDVSKEEYNKIKEEVLKNIAQRIVTFKNAEGKVNLEDASIGKVVDERLNSHLPDDKSKEAFSTILAKYKLTMAHAKMDYENTLKMEKVKEWITSSYVPSDEEAKLYFEANKEKYSSGEGKVNVSSIKLKSGEEGAIVIGKLQKGEKFEDLAKLYSTDDKTKNVGGLIGDIKTNDQMVDPEFIKQAMKLEPGKYSSVINVNGTNYIIKLNSKVAQQPKSFEDVKAQIKKDPILVNGYKGKQAQETINKWLKETKITRDEVVISQI